MHLPIMISLVLPWPIRCVIFKWQIWLSLVCMSDLMGSTTPDFSSYLLCSLVIWQETATGMCLQRQMNKGLTIILAGLGKISIFLELHGYQEWIHDRSILRSIINNMRGVRQRTNRTWVCYLVPEELRTEDFTRETTGEGAVGNRQG